MGTRSLTIIEDHTLSKLKEQLVIYRQFDGHPSGHGRDLAVFLSSGRVVNGISCAEKDRVFNGAGCLAAQLLAELKDGPGNIYAYRAGTRNCWEEYRYHVAVNGPGEDIVVTILIGYEKRGWTKIFEGTPQEMLAWINMEE